MMVRMNDRCRGRCLDGVAVSVITSCPWGWRFELRRRQMNRWRLWFLLFRDLCKQRYLNYLLKWECCFRKDVKRMYSILGIYGHTFVLKSLESCSNKWSEWTRLHIYSFCWLQVLQEYSKSWSHYSYNLGFQFEIGH